MEPARGEDAPRSRIQRARLYIWTTFENPSSSLVAKVTSFLMITTIILSILNMSVGSLDDKCHWASAFTPDASRLCLGHRIEEYQASKDIEFVCIMIFSVEYVLRICTCTVVRIKVWRFVVDPLNVLDLVAIGNGL